MTARHPNRVAIALIAVALAALATCRAPEPEPLPPPSPIPAAQVAAILVEHGDIAWRAERTSQGWWLREPLPGAVAPRAALEIEQALDSLAGRSEARPADSTADALGLTPRHAPMRVRLVADDGAMLANVVVGAPHADAAWFRVDSAPQVWRAPASLHTTLDVTGWSLLDPRVVPFEPLDIDGVTLGDVELAYDGVTWTAPGRGTEVDQVAMRRLVHCLSGLRAEGWEPSRSDAAVHLRVRAGDHEVALTSVADGRVQVGADRAAVITGDMWCVRASAAQVQGAPLTDVRLDRLDTVRVDDSDGTVVLTLVHDPEAPDARPDIQAPDGVALDLHAADQLVRAAAVLRAAPGRSVPRELGEPTRTIVLTTLDPALVRLRVWCDGDIAAASVDGAEPVPIEGWACARLTSPLAPR